MQKFIVSLAFAASVAAQASQITDGQVQAGPEVTPVAQITDGQVQAQTSAVVTPVQQITDGQVQAPTSVAVVTPVQQITDGQVQAPTSAVVTPVQQITDGQVQVQPTVTPVQQISDGQVQAGATGASAGMPAPSSNGTVASPSPSAFVGAANVMAFSKEMVIAAVGAAAGFAML
ncbi:hypothetical protein ACLMJK_008456 [Lecanora helva]